MSWYENLLANLMHAKHQSQNNSLPYTFKQVHVYQPITTFFAQTAFEQCKDRKLVISLEN